MTQTDASILIEKWIQCWISWNISLHMSLHIEKIHSIDYK